MKLTHGGAASVLVLTIGCARNDPPAPPTLTAASCPHDGPMMPMGAGARGMSMHGVPAASNAGVPLAPTSKDALLRALDEEYRAEALYGSIVDRLGARPPIAPIARAERRHAWVLESLALAHDIALPANRWANAEQPAIVDVPAACRAGAESEKQTIALYDALLATDVAPDLRRAFEHLRAASASRHLPAFEACR